MHVHDMAKFPIVNNVVATWNETKFTDVISGVFFCYYIAFQVFVLLRNPTLLVIMSPSLSRDVTSAAGSQILM